MNQRISGVSFLRGLAAFGIVGCHLALSPRSGLGAFVTSFCDLNVGIFATIGGFLMARGAVSSYGEYFFRRAKRILPVYLFWTAVFLVASAAFQKAMYGSVKPRYETVDFWIAVIFQGGASCHLWFLISLFYAQCILAAVRSFKSSGRVFLVIGFCIVVLSALIGGWYGNYPLRLLGFLVSGYGLASLDFSANVRRLGFFAVGALVLHVALRGLVPAFVRDWIVAMPVVMTFVQLQVDIRWTRLADLLGETSFGVYLIHPLFAAGFGAMIRRVFQQPYGVVPVTFDWIVCWALSLAVTLALMRTPGVKRFVR